jgi:hypothetical protein
MQLKFEGALDVTGIVGVFVLTAGGFAGGGFGPKRAAGIAGGLNETGDRCSC